MEEGEEGEAEWDRPLVRRESQAGVPPVPAEGEVEWERLLALEGSQERAPPVPVGEGVERDHPLVQ